MGYADFALTREKAPCQACAHSAGGCKARSACSKWADWEKSKAQRYADVRIVREAQVGEFNFARATFRRALSRNAAGR
jgi:hypothetical protein